MKLRNAAAVLLLLLTGMSVVATATPPDSAGTGQPTADTTASKPQVAAAPEDTVPKILRIYCPDTHEDSMGHFDDQLVFMVNTLKPFIGNEDKIVLYVDGLPLASIKGAPNYVTREVVFTLKRTPELLAMFTFGTNHEKFWLSPGLMNGYYYGYENRYTNLAEDNFDIILFDWMTLMLAAAVTLTSVFLVLYLGVFKKNPRSVLLRESLGGDGDDESKPYSLSKVQLAFWTVVIGTSILYLWLITGEFNLLTPQAMLLLGISVGTTGMSAVVATQLNDAEKRILKQQKSEGFFVDILSDAKGISITRMQNFLFTMIYGIIFVVTVARQLKMPEFDSNALILMGISSGAYVLYKAVENKGMVPVPPAPPAPPAEGGEEGAS